MNMYTKLLYSDRKDIARGFQYYHEYDNNRKKMQILMTN